MARVIEFRAWNKYHKKMHSVYEINFEHSIAKTRDDETGGTYTFGFIDLELMQFTGLNDQDGVKIFEGDIVDMVWIKSHYRGVVEFADGHFKVCHSEGKTPVSYPYLSCMLIRGNIHQNPELLEKK